MSIKYSLASKELKYYDCLKFSMIRSYQKRQSLIQANFILGSSFYVFWFIVSFFSLLTSNQDRSGFLSISAGVITCLAFTGYGCNRFFSKSKYKYFIYLFVVQSLLFFLSVCMGNLLPDFSIGPSEILQESVLALSKKQALSTFEWPIPEHSNAITYFATALFQATDNIRLGMSLNFLTFFGTLFLVWAALLQVEKASMGITFTVSLLTALNPVTITELFTYQFFGLTNQIFAAIFSVMSLVTLNSKMIRFSIIAILTILFASFAPNTTFQNASNSVSQSGGFGPLFISLLCISIIIFILIYSIEKVPTRLALLTHSLTLPRKVLLKHILFWIQISALGVAALNLWLITSRTMPYKFNLYRTQDLQFSLMAAQRRPVSVYSSHFPLYQFYLQKRGITFHLLGSPTELPCQQPKFLFSGNLTYCFEGDL